MMSAKVGRGRRRQFWVLANLGKLPDSFWTLARNEKGETKLPQKRSLD